MADLYSKVTRRPRSKLERLLELLKPSAIPRRPESRVATQLALFYLVAADVSPEDASKIVKGFVDASGALLAKPLLELDHDAVAARCAPRSVTELLADLRALGEAVRDGLEEACRRDADEARRRVGALPKLSPEHVDLILLTSGALSTVAPSAAARRVACRLGYPGSSYASLSRALDAEIPEGDATFVAWRAHHALAQHGKDVCLPAQPQCDRCVLSGACSYRGQGADPAARLSIPGT